MRSKARQTNPSFAKGLYSLHFALLSIRTGAMGKFKWEPTTRCHVFVVAKPQSMTNPPAPTRGLETQTVQRLVDSSAVEDVQR
jgi:hypothetical protein